MTIGFGISEEDIETVLRRCSDRIQAPHLKAGKADLTAIVDQAFEDLDHETIEAAALRHSNTLSEQTDAALAEIERQLVEQGVLAAA